MTGAAGAAGGTLAAGSRATFRHKLTEAHTVPRLLPEAASFAAMPGVLATGTMVGLMEWACIEHLAPHLGDGQGSLGTHVDVSHVAATPPGLTLEIETEVLSVEGRSVWFRVRAHDGVDMIGEGRHRRAIVEWDRFVPRAMAKAERAGE